MVRKLIILILMLTGATMAVKAQTVNNAFTFGEKITYKVRYNLYFNINVGEVAFEVKPEAQTVAGKSCFHIIAKGKTYGFYDPLYKVRDHYESYVDTKSLLPMIFIRNVQEGDFKFTENVLFDHNKHLAISKKRTQTIPALTQDVVSAIYYARTLDFTNAKMGDKYLMHAFIDDSSYQVGVRYAGKETIKTSIGKFNCIKLIPILVADRMFKSEEDMVMWVTDDENHVPVRIESGISVGAIRADIESYSGLKNPMTAKR